MKRHRRLILLLLFVAAGFGCHGPTMSSLPPAVARPYSERELAAQEQDGICAMHDVALRPDVVEVRYGLLDEHYFNAKFTRFPHSDTFVSGGCLVGEPRTAVVLYCQQCRDAEESWRAAWGGTVR